MREQGVEIDDLNFGGELTSSSEDNVIFLGVVVVCCFFFFFFFFCLFVCFSYSFYRHGWNFNLKKYIYIYFSV